jgi:hypothetical protein
VAAAKPQTGWFPSRNLSKCILKRLGLGTTPSARKELEILFARSHPA